MRSLVVMFVFSLMTCGAILLGESGSCVQYAELVCEICGEETDVCAEIREKVKEHPNDPACRKGLTLLPAAMEDASDEDRARIMQALCHREMPADL
ncbi:MAG: hypothetical protein ACOC2H_06225 [Spirochaetota bacterium]